MKKILALTILCALNSFALTNEEGLKLVTEFNTNNKVTSTKHYCIKGGMTCRTIFTYVTTQDAQPVKSFKITFYSAERQVAASEYYIQQGQSDIFNRIIDKTYDGAVNVDRADEVQTVLFQNNDVIIKNLYMPKLGTTEYIESDLVFSDALAYLDGASKDTSDPTVSKPVRIEYYRIQP